MIKVRVQTVRNCIQTVKLKGHADSAPHGRDLVCAAVSSMAVGTLNALAEMCENSFTASMDAGDIEIHITNLQDSDCQLICRTFLIQLKTIEESYSKYIQIQQEVSS